MNATVLVPPMLLLPKKEAHSSIRKLVRQILKHDWSGAHEGLVPVPRDAVLTIYKPFGLAIGRPFILLTNELAKRVGHLNDGTFVREMKSFYAAAAKEEWSFLGSYIKLQPSNISGTIERLQRLKSCWATAEESWDSGVGLPVFLQELQDFVAMELLAIGVPSALEYRSRPLAPREFDRLLSEAHGPKIQEALARSDLMRAGLEFGYWLAEVEERVNLGHDTFSAEDAEINRRTLVPRVVRFYMEFFAERSLKDASYIWQNCIEKLRTRKAFEGRDGVFVFPELPREAQ